jgi:hypothetical protein
MLPIEVTTCVCFVVCLLGVGSVRTARLEEMEEDKQRHLPQAKNQTKPDMEFCTSMRALLVEDCLRLWKNNYVEFIKLKV